ncbi:Squalene--hopene cyclase [Colletotrichum sidae]|uniref:Terpene cyclase/mutase family member n=1 Tax=Colletotrichum sidae TaxID=1347389 RepID=A0A4R8TK31_9PEZI|nr:Squalene--hopene cyclase [Colletotrichum sidae]
MATNTILLTQQNKTFAMATDTVLLTQQDNDLAASATQCVKQAAEHAYSQMKPDGHWYLEVRSSISFTVQWICIRQIVGPAVSPEEADKFRKWLLSQQNDEDGSWGLAPAVHDWAGDVSTTVEAYFGLKLLGTPVESKAMRKARAFILRNGGVARVGVLTQLVLALFGIVAWKDMAQVPAELMALPAGLSPVNIYSFSYWSRVSAVPVMLLKHHQPIFSLSVVGSDGEEVLGATFLDEVFVNPLERRLTSIPELSTLWREGQLGRLACTIIDKAASVVEPLLKRSMLRKHCLDQCVQYIVNHLDAGGFGSLTISNFLCVVGLHASGFPASHPVMGHLTRAMQDALWEDDDGLRMQVTIGPVWDTALMTLGLLETGLADGRTDKSIKWFKDHQILKTHGDYVVTNPRASLPGGWSFQYCNEYFPDNDDTLVCLFAIIMRNPKEINSACGARALNWLLAMQGGDGGWGAYDIDNTSRIANLFPFADGVEFFDPSVPDISGRVLEVLGYILTDPTCSAVLPPAVYRRVREACRRGLRYLSRSQDKLTGTWRARWHVNHLNGTSSVLCALPHLKSVEQPEDGIPVEEPIAWIKAVQNPDGGWGESLGTYRDESLAGRGLVSTPSQTAWAVMGLLAHLPHTDPAVERGVQYLVRTQVRAATGVTWDQDAYLRPKIPRTPEVYRLHCSKFRLR